MTEEVRAYTDKEVEDLGSKGEAFKNSDGTYSYPIANEADLKKAVSAVGRGNADHDDIRKYIMKRAKALDKSDLIPDNWNSDGSLKETKGVWSTQEERDTYNDRRRAVETAISDSMPKSKEGERWYVYVMDMTDEWAVYEYKGDLYQVEYTETDDGEIALGATIKVRRVTTYVETKNEDKELEWRRAKAEEMSGRALEHRAFPAVQMECREADDGELTLTGYASVTEAPYDVGFYTETISRGAFKRTLKEDPDVVLLLNHEGLPLARTKGGTLTLEEDRHGLYIEASLDPQDPDAQTLARKMKRGDLDGQMSFAFCPVEQDWSEDFTERTIKAVTINRGDVSIVTQGANPATSSTIRSLEQAGQDAMVTMFSEYRAGKTLSTGSMQVLEKVLSLVANADEAVDEAQPMLAKLMGVPNPDAEDAADDSVEDENGGDGETEVVFSSAAVDGRSALDSGALGDFTTRAKQRYLALQLSARDQERAV